MRDLSGGTAEEQLKVMKKFLDHVVCMRTEEKDSLVWKIIFSIKTLMTDRCIVQKNFNHIFNQFRKDVLPTVVEGWAEMEERMEKHRQSEEKTTLTLEKEAERKEE